MSPPHNHLARSRSMRSSLFPIILYSCLSVAQQISTNTPVPPLQWINLTPLLTGSPPPGLKDASIGYDETSRNLIVFGGESSQGFPQATTYLLHLDNLQWGTASPQQGFEGNPPARSAAISGVDFAASYRHSFLVAGGQGSSGPLQDVWEFDFSNQFWSEVVITGDRPSARRGAVGGIDTRTLTIPDVNRASPNNSYYLAGGFDGTNSLSLSDSWRLNISGTLSSNNRGDVVGSWEHIPFTDKLPGRTDMSGAIVFTGSQQHIVSVGGCSSSNANATCGDGLSYVLNVDALSDNSPPKCPAPRSDPAITANLVPPTNTFGSQVFQLLGTYNTTAWDDDNGLNMGEVDILDISTGAWARILPSGDPNSDPAFPTPREGAVALSFATGLVGSNRNQVSDTLVFGGRDASGNYLNELWLLRAYNGTITQSNQKWSGFGNGKLTGGADATGAGVTVKYMTACATALVADPTAGSSPTGSGSGNGQTGSGGQTSPAQTDLYDTSVVHKILAPASVAVGLPAVLLFRVSGFSMSHPDVPGPTLGLFYASVVIAIVAFGVGVGGLVSSFTSIALSSTTTTTTLARRAASSSSLHLQTGHGRAGLALFVALYGLVPVLMVISMCIKLRRNGGISTLSLSNGRSRYSSSEAPEKRVDSPTGAASEKTSVTGDRPYSRGRRHRSWSSFGVWPGSRTSARLSEESISREAASPNKRSFEVTNRPQRQHHASVHSLAAFNAEQNRPGPTTRSVSEGGWFDRRSPDNGDYALNNLPPTPGTAVLDMTSTRGLVANSPDFFVPHMPPFFDSLIHILLQALVLGLSVLSLIMLWTHAEKAGFGVLLAWTLVFYAIIFTLAWKGTPKESILSTILSRLRGDSQTNPGQAPSRPLSDATDRVPFPSVDGRGPYQHHQPPYRSVPHNDDYLSAGGYPSSQGHDGLGVDDYDDEDDDTRQRQIEEEMSRREVSIVTVPKRKFVVTNPGL